MGLIIDFRTIHYIKSHLFYLKLFSLFLPDFKLQLQAFTPVQAAEFTMNGRKNNTYL